MQVWIVSWVEVLVVAKDATERRFSSICLIRRPAQLQSVLLAGSVGGDYCDLMGSGIRGR